MPSGIFRLLENLAVFLVPVMAWQQAVSPEGADHSYVLV